MAECRSLSREAVSSKIASKAEELADLAEIIGRGDVADRLRAVADEARFTAQPRRLS